MVFGSVSEFDDICSALFRNSIGNQTQSLVCHSVYDIDGRQVGSFHGTVQKYQQQNFHDIELRFYDNSCSSNLFRGDSFMIEKKCLIAVDFDGTIASRDVGYSFFHHFSGGKNVELLPFWKSGEMSTRECLLREAALVKTSKDQAYKFLEDFELDGAFPEFAEACREQKISLTILSDGLDFYIDFLLNKFKLAGIKAISNKAIFENGGVSIIFPYDNRRCKSCGSCKEERIEDLKEQHQGKHDVVFIGDGYSDACAAKAADVLFAKKDLKKYCIDNVIEYLDYDDFDDVRSKLVDLGYMKGTG